MTNRKFETRYEKFRYNLDIYGSDISRWPEDLRVWAENALRQSHTLRDLVDQEELFEQQLNMRCYEEPSSDLSERIISSVKSKKSQNISRSKSVSGYLDEILGSFKLPSPAFSLSLILIFGITLGYLSGYIDTGPENQTLLNQLTFYEEGFYEFEN